MLKFWTNLINKI